MSTPDRNQRNVGGDQSVPGIEDDVQSVTGVSAAGKSVQGESRTAAARTGPGDKSAQGESRTAAARTGPVDSKS